MTALLGSALDSLNDALHADASRDVGAAIPEASGSVTEGANALEELADEVRDELLNRLRERERVEAWKGHVIGNGSISIGTIALTEAAVWIVRVDVNDDVVTLRFLESHETLEQALAAVPGVAIAVRDDVNLDRL